MKDCRIVLRLLGAFELTVDGKPAAGVPKKAQALLALIALHPERKASVEECERLLWRRSEGDRSTANVRQALSKLRTAFGRDKVRIKLLQGDIHIDLSDVWVDAEHFREKRKSEEWLQAEALYRDDLLANVNERALKNERLYLKTDMGIVLNRLIVHSREIGDEEAEVKRLTRLLTLFPEREEETRRALILLWKTDSNRALSLHRTHLASLPKGATPSKQLTQLIENLLAYGSPVETSLQKLPLPEKIPAERHTIDTPATTLVGRAEQIEDIGIRLMESRLVTLIGMGGVGKTRLAIEIGLKLASNYLSGVVFVDFSDFLSSSAEEELSNALLESLKITALSGESPHETLVRNLQNQEILIVLDNCEHLLNSVAKLCKFLLLNTNYLRILATSRERIRIVEERSFVVKELSTPLSGGVYDIETLRDSEAISLLVQRIQANRPDFDLNNENANDLLEICQKLEGNALGIELAAGMLAEIEPSALVKGLQESFWTLDDQGDRTRPERYNSLRAMIAWSYRLLTPDEASLFQELSLLSAGWSYEAALAIRTPISNELSLMSLLTSLLTKSLILTRTQNVTRYRMLEMLRQFGREKLEESGRGESVKNRLAKYIQEIAEELKPNIASKEALDRFELEHANVRETLLWRIQEGKKEDAFQLLNIFWRYLFRRGRIQEGLSLYDKVFGLSGEVAVQTQIEALNAQGGLRYLRGELDLAKECFEQLLRISEKENDLEWTSAAHLGLGNVARERYLDIEAKEHYCIAIALSSEIGNIEDADVVKANLAVIFRRLGQFEECFELLEELVEKFRQRGDLVNRIITLITYAISLGLSGRPQKIPEILFETWGLCTTLNYPSGKYRCLTVAHTLSVNMENWRDAALFAGSIHALEHKSDYVTEASLQTYQSNMQLTKANLREEEYEEAFQAGSRLALPSFKLLA